MWDETVENQARLRESDDAAFEGAYTQIKRSRRTTGCSGAKLLDAQMATDAILSTYYE
jgi:hypothetical protein